MLLPTVANILSSADSPRVPPPAQSTELRRRAGDAVSDALAFRGALRRARAPAGIPCYCHVAATVVSRSDPVT